MNELTEFNTLRDEFETKTRSLKQAIQEKGIEIFLPHFQKFFTLEPRLKAIRWNQYTPYFNDGDACVFGIGQVFIRWESVEETDGDYGDGFVYGQSQYNSETRSMTYGPDHATIKGLVSDIQQFVNENEEACEMAFGDHVKITVDSEGIEIQGCDHD